MLTYIYFNCYKICSDFWWFKHEMTCGGKFEKVKEPEGYKPKSATGSWVFDFCSVNLTKITFQENRNTKQI